MIDGERMAQIDRLFEEVLDAAPDEAERLLAWRAEEDPDLVREVRALLDFDRSGEAITLPFEAGRWAAWATGSAEEEIGSRVGSYRLLRPLGRGGMGIVWLAERADGGFEQRVALKVLPAGFLTENARRRFERERQILAHLSHDNVARLLDGGVDGRGRPFLAMELVEGRSITEYCDRERLPLEGRLRLVISAARAVQAAHRSRIVHCDLKPANLLVTDRGVVKLLDFGIAELLGGERDAEADVPQGRRLTPEYASPESLAGAPVTTAADVYQLGLLVYELGCGRRARRGFTGPIGSLLPEKPFPSPVPPSAALFDAEDGGLPASEIAARRRTTPSRLRRALEGDLDAIVARATSRNPDDRYPSAEALARDLERFLEGRPVEARDAGWADRAWKLVRRHPAISGLLGALVVLAAGLAYQTGVARQERDRAEREADVARALAARTQEVSDFLVSILTDASLEDIRGDLTVVEMLDEGRRRVGSEFPEESTARAELEEILGRVYFSVGRPAESLSLLEDAVERRRAQGATPEDLAESILHLARAHIELGHHDESKRLLEEGLELQQRADGGVTRSWNRAETLSLLSYVHGMLGELEPTLSLRRESLEIRQALFGPDHLETAQGLNDLCFAHNDVGEYERAETLCRRAVKIRRASGRDDLLMGSLNNLARVEARLGRLDSAKAHNDEALTLALARLPREHPTCGRYYATRGEILFGQGRVDEAAEAFAEARSILTAVRPAGHRDLAWIEVLAAQPEIATGDPRVAEDRARSALGLLRRNHGEDQHLVLQARIVLAESLVAQGREAEARAELEDVERRLRPGRSDGEIWLRRARAHLARLDPGTP